MPENHVLPGADATAFSQIAAMFMAVAVRV